MHHGGVPLYCSAREKCISSPIFVKESLGVSDFAFQFLLSSSAMLRGTKLTRVYYRGRNCSLRYDREEKTILFLACFYE